MLPALAGIRTSPPAPLLPGHAGHGLVGFQLCGLSIVCGLCRATLEAHGMSVGNESPPAPPETMPDIQTRELVMLIKRLASSLKAVKPDSCVVREAQDWLRDRKLVDITDILR
ncbi:Uncharacterised protein [Shigella sonnei]|nr:Uncharacterised protein [Shigella sonnei]